MSSLNCLRRRTVVVVLLRRSQQAVDKVLNFITTMRTIYGEVIFAVVGQNDLGKTTLLDAITCHSTSFDPHAYRASNRKNRNKLTRGERDALVLALLCDGNTPHGIATTAREALEEATVETVRSALKLPPGQSHRCVEPITQAAV